MKRTEKEYCLLHISSNKDSLAGPLPSLFVHHSCQGEKWDPPSKDLCSSINVLVMHRPPLLMKGKPCLYARWGSRAQG